MTVTRELRTRSFALPGAVDLLDYYDPAQGFYLERGGDGIVGVGSAINIVVPPGEGQPARAAAMAREALARVAVDGDEPPLVVGTLPFEPTRPALLVVPAIAVVRRRRRTWMLVTGSEDLPEPETTLHVVPPEPWGSLRIVEEPPGRRYVDAVAQARARIEAGELRKVVLARSLRATSDHVFDPLTLVARLRDVEAASFVFADHGFIGASPELLVRRTGHAVETRPLAGTTRRGVDAHSDEDARAGLLASDKDRREHLVVVEAVRAALSPLCETLDVPETPSLLSTSAVWHLATHATGTLRAPAPDALTLAASLHPTPAVCGTPTATARALIRELEGFDRGSYAGMVGWMDAEGDGEFAVALRCADVRGNEARLYAGAGIVAGSDPEAELAETDAKFAAMLDALGYA